MIKFTSDKIFSSQLAESQNVVIVDFFATWCGPCKMLGPELEILAGEMNNIDIIKADVDECAELAGKFNVNVVPTLVIFQNCKAKERLEGYMEHSQLKEILEKYTK